MATQNPFYDLLKNLSEKDIEDFFEQEFLKPLLSQLDGGSEPAENIRQQRKQTIKIKNILLAKRREIK